MADLGYVTLLIALALSIYTLIASLLGARRGYEDLAESARNGVLAVAALLSLAAAALIYALVTHDFQTKYVAEYSSRDMSLLYTLSAFYAGNAGSLLLWVWLLSLFAAVVVVQNRDRHRELMPYVSAILMGIAIFFLGLTTFVANPFERLSFLPEDGRGLNPLLENMGMFFHPPTLYLGYVGFAVPYAFALASLITGRLGDDWIRSTRRWTLFAWFFLGLGNLFGAQWAYVELGWGGYWAWDPVENASFMPWLVGTAYLHSVMIQTRKGMLKVWNMVLIIITFLLTIFGTFLTRSGVLSSVHTFSESGLGPLFFAFIGVSLAVSLWFLLNRLPMLRSENELDSLLSRESTFLLNNLILVGAAFATFWGVVFPLISEAVRGVKITVGPPFFDQVNGPIFLLLILLMGVCPLIGWRKASWENLLRNFGYPAGGALLLVVAAFLIGLRAGFALLAFGLCAFVILTISLEWFRGVRARHRTRGENYLRAFFSLIWANKPRYGGYIVHLGIILMAIGITGSTFYKVEKEANLLPGQEMSINGYSLRFEGISEYPTRSKQVTSATLSVFNGDEPLGRMVSEKYVHRNHEGQITEVAIRTTLLEDLYVILAGWDADGSASFKVLINPLVVWIWIGGAVLLVGTVIAFWPDRMERRRLTPSLE